jgi:hypothetical protein
VGGRVSDVPAGSTERGERVVRVCHKCTVAALSQPGWTCPTGTT